MPLVGQRKTAGIFVATIPHTTQTSCRTTMDSLSGNNEVNFHQARQQKEKPRSKEENIMNDS